MQNELDNLLPRLQTGISKQWTGQWYTRTILRSRWRNRKIVLHQKDINLESQVWALINDSDTYNMLADSVYDLLDKSSPTGAPTMQNGEVWPAISQMLTWGYTRHRPELAWQSLLKNTFAAHAETFPDIWIGVWSGPDGTYTVNSKHNPGGTWASPVTPMTDYPVMNNNPHSMSLLALLRVCGIEPSLSGDGLRIAPPSTPERFKLDLPLLKLDVSPGNIQFEYRPIVDGERRFYICSGSDASNTITTLNGQSYGPETHDGYLVFHAAFAAGETVTIQVKWD
jgi:hypothetical protein